MYIMYVDYLIIMYYVPGLAANRSMSDINATTGCSVSCCRILSKSGIPLSAEFGNWSITLTQRR